MNTRRYPRTLQEAFGPYTDNRLLPIPDRRRPLLDAARQGFMQPFHMLAAPVVLLRRIFQGDRHGS